MYEVDLDYNCTVLYDDIFNHCYREEVKREKRDEQRMASSSNDNKSGEENSTILRAATTSTSSGTGTGYVEEHFPPEIIERLESGAFRALRTHLQERSDQVPNLELMTVSGFCRNCLAKVRAAYELGVRRVRPR